MLTIWNPVTQVFEALNGDNSSQQGLLLNLLIENRVQTKILMAIGADVMSDSTEQGLRLDTANELPNFVTGAVVTNNL